MTSSVESGCTAMLHARAVPVHPEAWIPNAPELTSVHGKDAEDSQVYESQQDSKILKSSSACSTDSHSSCEPEASWKAPDQVVLTRKECGGGLYSDSCMSLTKSVRVRAA